MSSDQGNPAFPIGSDDVSGTGDQPTSLNQGNPALPIERNDGSGTVDHPTSLDQGNQALPIESNGGSGTVDHPTSLDQGNIALSIESNDGSGTVDHTTSLDQGNIALSIGSNDGSGTVDHPTSLEQENLALPIESNDGSGTVDHPTSLEQENLALPIESNDGPGTVDHPTSLDQGNPAFPIESNDGSGTVDHPTSLDQGNIALSIESNDGSGTVDHPTSLEQENLALPIESNIVSVIGHNPNMKTGKINVPLNEELRIIMANQKAVQLMCTELKKDLKELKEKLGAKPVLQPTVDRMTFVDQFFPHFSPKAAAKEFNFEERIILSSATIYRNEKYQELLDRLEAHEIELTMELLPVEHSFLSLLLEEHFQNVQKKVSENYHYRNLQAKLLQMRIKRRQLEMQAGNKRMFLALGITQPWKHATPTVCAYDYNEELNSVVANQTEETQLMCTEMKNDLKELKGKLVATPLLQPNTPVDRMTFVDQFFPHLTPNAAVKEFNFEERLILSSATIYRNEKYQELLNRLEAHELKLIMELLPVEHSMFLTIHELAQKVEKKISSTNDYQTLQAKLLQMRIKRRHLELRVKAHKRPRNTCNPPPANINNEASSSDGTGGSSSLIYPKM
ncbi:hypothetical protein PGT21_002302 [Puccinia graminis f. sp. tritici]|uniref:Uncharacterized protein n=1 Tax=Puccinia graminis f. sp. tritici TaxID=56615 RepID=A0A5B0Q500_PUCGR|nr:hypothetical protein PGT21_002302 [Puccinia graminis f. sp. tritici]